MKYQKKKTHDGVISIDDYVSYLDEFSYYFCSFNNITNFTKTLKGKQNAGD